MKPREFKDRKFAGGRSVRCWLCSGYVQRENATVDHLVARSAGGGNARVNMKIAHPLCNQLRGDRPLTEAEWQRARGRAPRRRRDYTQLAEAIQRARKR